MKVRRTVSVVAGVAAAAGVALAGAGVAAAATPVSGPSYIGVELTHEETVLAAQVRAGDLINAAFGDNWSVGLPADSVWHTGGWTPVTGHQFFEEAASHPGGKVRLYLRDPAVHPYPFTAISAW